MIDLCAPCGMCCNGTLFNYVTVTSDDLPKLLKYPQLKWKIRREQSTFDEPCVLHTGTSCGAYEDRPATCERYVCDVLKAVAKETLSEEDALLIIQEGKALVENVKEYVTFEPGMPLAVSTWDGPPEGISEEAQLAWERTTRHLGRHFLGTVKDDVTPPKVSRESLFAAKAKPR